MTTAVAREARLELRVLFCIARAQLPPTEMETLAELLQQDLDWNYLLTAAARHGVWPLLQQHVEQSAPALIPETVREALRKVMHDHAAYALTRVGELHALLDGFRGEGLDLIPYKGPVLAERLYGGCALRQFGDLDFLVRRPEARRAQAYLLGRGFQPSLAAPPGWEAWYERARNEYSLQHPTSGLYVELHWGAWQRFVGMPVEVLSFWEHRETVLLAGRPVPSLGMEELLFLLCLHGTKHQWCRLGWLADVAEILRSTPRLDWPRVLALAAASRSERFLGIGLWLAERLLAAPVPGGVLARLTSDRRMARLAGAMARALCHGSLGTPGEMEHLLFMLRALPRQRDRLRLLWGVATEPCRDDWTFCRLPPALAGLYAVVRPWRLFWTAVQGKIPR